MIPFPVHDRRRVDELEDEIELLRGSIPLDKAYFQRKYQLQLKRRKHERLQVIQHLLLYIVCNAILIGINIYAGGGFPWSIFPLILWGIGVLIQYASFIQKFNFTLNRYSKQLNLELMKQYEQSQLQ